MIRLASTVLVGAVTMMGCTSDDPAVAPPPAVASGAGATFGRDDPEAGPACFLALDQAEVERLWLLGDAGTQAPPPPVPIDLDPPVVGLFLGVRQSGSQPPQVVSVDVEGDAAVVTVEVTDATGDAVAGAPEASPYALVAVPSTSGAARIAGGLDLTCEARVPELPGSGEPDDDEVGS